MCSVHGGLSFSIVNQRYQPVVYTALIATGSAVLGTFAPYESIKIISATMLTSIAYGVANDMIACRDCIEYFTIGHQYDAQRLRNRPLNTLNPNLNALAWGSIATWHVGCIAGIFFAAVARIPFPKLSDKISMAQLVPSLVLVATLTLIVSHVVSRRAQRAMRESPYYKYAAVPMELQSGWEACNMRNAIGYLGLALGGGVFTVSIVAARAGLMNFPFSTFRH